MASLIFRPDVADRWGRWDPRGRVTQYWHDLAADDPMLRKARVCVELVFGDEVVLVSSDVVRTTSGRDGDAFCYLPLLEEEPEIPQSVVLGQQSAAQRSVTLRMAANPIDPNALIARGRVLAGVAEISLQVDGGDYDRRWVLMRGEVTSGPTFGTVDEMVEITVSDPRQTASLLVPQHAVDTDRWPTALAGDVGKRYPLVINGYPKVPALNIDSDASPRYLIASPPANLAIGTVYRNGESIAGSEYTEQEEVDGAGVRVLSFDTSGVGVITWDDRDRVHVDVELDSGVVPRTAAEVIAYLLTSYTGLGPQSIDQESVAEAIALMGGTPAPKVMVNASGAQAIDVLQFIEQTLLPSFPMIHLAFLNGGLGPVVVDRRVRPSHDAIGHHLIGGRGLLLDRISGPVEYPVEDLRTEFEVRHSMNLLERSHEGVYRLGPSANASAALTEQLIGGPRPDVPIESPVIHDERLAAYIAEWLAEHRAVPSYWVEWSTVAAAHLFLRPGRTVLYTDPDFPAFTNCVATIEQLPWQRGNHRIGLRVWHPAFNSVLQPAPSTNNVRPEPQPPEVTFLGGASAAMVYLEADIASGVSNYIVEWDASYYGGVDNTDDLQGEWFDATNPTRLTVPDGYDGKRVRFRMSALLAGGTSDALGGHAWIELYKNGSFYRRLLDSQPWPDGWSPSGNPFVTESEWIDATAGDYYEMHVRAASSSAITVRAVQQTWFFVEADVNANDEPAARFNPPLCRVYLSGAYSTSSTRSVAALDATAVDDWGGVVGGDDTEVVVSEERPWIWLDAHGTISSASAFCEMGSFVTRNYDGNNDWLATGSLAGSSGYTSAVSNDHMSCISTGLFQLDADDVLQLILRKNDGSSDNVRQGAFLSVGALTSIEETGTDATLVCSVTNSTGSITTNGSDLIDSWDTELQNDVAGVIDLGTDATRLTVPAGYTRVRCTTSYTIDPGNTGAAYASIFINGDLSRLAPFYAITLNRHGRNNNGSLGLAFFMTTGWIDVSEGDYFQVRSEIADAGNVNPGYFQLELAP